jgi:hypothetical protein
MKLVHQLWRNYFQLWPFSFFELKITELKSLLLTTFSVITLNDFGFALFRNFTRAPNLRAEFSAFLVRVLEIIIIITGRRAPSDPQPSLEDSPRFVLNQTIRFSLLWIPEQ